MIRRNPLVESFAPRPKDLWNQKCHTQKLIFLLFGYRVPKGCIKRYPLEPSLVGTTTLRCPNSRNHSWGDRRRPMEYIDPTDCWLHFTIYVIHDVYILHYVSKCIMCIYIYIICVAYIHPLIDCDGFPMVQYSISILWDPSHWIRDSSIHRKIQWFSSMIFIQSVGTLW